MRTLWLLAKYMPDLARREPINVGLLAVQCTDVVVDTECRFLAQTSTDAVDGRRLPRTHIRSLDNYKAWVEYWQEQAEDLKGCPLAELERLIRPESLDNYYMERGGERIAGPCVSLSALVDELFPALVADEEPEVTLSLQKRSELVFKRLNILGRMHQRLRLDIGPMPVFFDYQFSLDADENYMQRVALGPEDALSRTWESVTLARYSFEQLDRRPLLEGTAKRRKIALVNTASAEAIPDTRKQLEALRAVADVVDLASTDVASDRLGKLLHLPTPPSSPSPPSRKNAAE